MNLEKKLCKQIPTPEEVKEEHLKALPSFSSGRKKSSKSAGKVKI